MTEADSERANHGRFNSVWDVGDVGPLASWMLDRGSVLTPDDQQHLARALVGAFLARSLDGQTEYDAFLRDPRAGRSWLPDDVVLTHWESSHRVATVDLAAGRVDDQPITTVGFSDVRRQDPQLRDGSFQADPAVRLEWSDDASFLFEVDAASASQVQADGQLVLSLVSADGTPIEPPSVALHLRDQEPIAVSLAAQSPMRPLLPTSLWKLPVLGDRYAPTERIDWPAERFAQTYAIDLASFGSAGSFEGFDIVAVEVRFHGRGAAFLDDIAFEPAVRDPG